MWVQGKRLALEPARRCPCSPLPLSMASTLAPRTVQAFFTQHKVAAIVCAAVIVLLVAVAVALALALQPPPPVTTFASGFKVTSIPFEANDYIANGTYSAVTDLSGTSGLQQDGETLLAVWIQDAPFSSTSPYFVTVSSTSSGQLVRRFLREVDGEFFEVLVNVDSAPAAGSVIPLDNTGTWTLIEADDRDSAGTVFDAQFVSVPEA